MVLSIQFFGVLVLLAVIATAFSNPIDTAETLRTADHDEGVVLKTVQMETMSHEPQEHHLRRQARYFPYGGGYGGYPYGGFGGYGGYGGGFPYGGSSSASASASASAGSGGFGYGR